MRGPRDRDAISDVLVVLLTFLVLGALSGVAWWVLVDPAVLTTTRAGGATGEVHLARRFDLDGWYAVVAMVAGFLSGLGVTWWRSRDYRTTTALVVAGSAVAAGTMAVVGRLLGPEGPDQVVSGAGRTGDAPVQLAVTVGATYLIWPVAVLFGALMVLWSSTRAGDGEHAGAGHDRLRPDADLAGGASRTSHGPDGSPGTG